MADYWLDADVYIRPFREGFYHPRLANFFPMLEELATREVIASPSRVLQELSDYGDDLAAWANTRSKTNLFVEPNQAVQDALRNISDYVMENYRGYKAQEFLGGADPWVIAHAVADNTVVVTYEARVNLTSQTPKIPNVCRAFSIRCIDLYRMFTDIGVVLEFRV